MSQLLFFTEMNNALPAILSIVLVNFCVQFIIDRKIVAVNIPLQSFTVSYLETIADCKKSAIKFHIPRSMVLIPELRKIIQAYILQVIEY